MDPNTCQICKATVPRDKTYSLCESLSCVCLDCANPTVEIDCELCLTPTPKSQLNSVGEFLSYVCSDCVKPILESNKQLKEMQDEHVKNYGPGILLDDYIMEQTTGRSAPGKPVEVTPCIRKTIV